MSKLVKGYKAVFKGATIMETGSSAAVEVPLGAKGKLTIWESESLHPGEKYIRFETEPVAAELQTSCGQIAIEDNVFTITTQKGANQYVFELLEPVQTIDFRMRFPEKYWHICSGCGKRQILSSKDAFEEGWDYPGPDGIYKHMPNYGFGALVPRTCGDCGIDSSLYWKLMVEKVDESEITADMKEMIERIQDEPMSLMVDDTENLD